MQRVIAYLITIAASLPAAAQDATSILQTAREKQLERWQDVEMYIVHQSVMGNATKTYFQRAEITDNDGDTQILFLPISPDSPAADSCDGTMKMTPDQLDAYASGLDTGSAAMGNEIENGLEQAGLPRGLLAASGSDPNATFDPRVMFGPGAGFLRAAAEYERGRPERAEAEAQDTRDSFSQMAEFMAAARLVGSEVIDGRTAFHLQASEINQKQPVDDGEFTMQTMSMWIDTAKYVPLRTKMDGVLKSGKESKPMTIENIQTDYRDVPDSMMYESHKQIMKISGMMDAAQEAEMRKAQQQMAEFEKQLASMPESQRAMMEKMVGPQMETMRNMMSGGGFQTEIVVSSIVVNPELTGQPGEPCPANSAKL